MRTSSCFQAPDLLRVVVLGLNLESLLACWILRQHPMLDVWLIAEQPLDLLLREDEVLFMPHTANISNLLRNLNVAYASFIPQDGMLLRGQIQPIARCSDEAVVRYAKDRTGEDIAAWIKAAKHRSRRLRCQLSDFLQALIRGLQYAVSPQWSLEPGEVVFGAQQRIEYDFAIVTGPLWKLKQRVWFETPQITPQEHAVVCVEPRRLAHFRRWDTVLTPYTPSEAANKVTVIGNLMLVEMAPGATSEAMISDLNFLFSQGYALQSIDVKRRLKDLVFLRWPENVVPLGSAVAMSSLAELVEGAYECMRRWIRR